MVASFDGGDMFANWKLH